MSEAPPLNHPPSARLFAAKAVQLVLEDEAMLETALSQQPGFNALDRRDRAFARLITATSFRRLGQIDAALKTFLKRNPEPLPHAILRTGAAQILFLSTPPHAAVSETVSLLKRSARTKGYAGLVNAVLRRVTEQKASLLAAHPPVKNIPGWIRASWEKAYGKPVTRRIAAQLIKEPPLDIYVKDNPDMWAERLGGEVLTDHVIRLFGGASVPDLPGFADGEWWVQDVAASLPVDMLGDIRGLTALDMCAAPGGKTLQLAAKGARVTALDKSEERLVRLRENLKRTNLTANITPADGIEWGKTATETYDIVLLDVPCSATGTFRRHPDVLYNKSPKHVASLRHIQRKLLNAAASRVKPGGRLIYCTCSLQYDEGEAQADAFLSKNSNFKLMPRSELNFQPDINPLKNAQNDQENTYLRVLPHFLGERGGMDGFFVAVMIYRF